jgi:hypothetical protein
MESRSRIKPGDSELQWSGGLLPAGRGDQNVVHGFNQVVAPLVKHVDRPLDPGQIGIGRIGGAGQVLFVPQIVVGAMLRNGKLDQIGVWLRLFRK